MPGLNPLMNAQPKTLIPSEAPAHFRPFFEQPEKPIPVPVWQPPTMEEPRRSKAPPPRERPPPPVIKTAGTWAERHSLEYDNNLLKRPGKRDREEEVPPAGPALFTPKRKRSDEEMMWLGNVTGFVPPQPYIPSRSEVKSIRSKLVRKPEEIASQASAATGPKAEELRKKKEEEERERENRLKTWGRKKAKDNLEKEKEKEREKEEKAKAIRKAVRELPPTPITEEAPSFPAPAPPPLERHGSSRRRVVQMLPQPIETMKISNRSGLTHRPHYPRDEHSFAPMLPILPQPIETVKKSTRGRKFAKSDKKEEMDNIWMGATDGLPQPIETVHKKRGPRTSTSIEQRKEVSAQPSTSEKKVFLPEPIETSKRTSRKSPLSNVDNAGGPKSFVPEVVETSKRSSRQPEKKPLLPEPVETTRKSNRPDPKPEAKAFVPEPVETTRKSNRPEKQPESKAFVPEPVETTRKSNRPAAPKPAAKAFVPEPVETSRKSNRPPPKSEAKAFTPEAVETSRRSSRPAEKKPESKQFVPEPVETSRRSNKLRSEAKPAFVPEPVETSRRSNRATEKPKEDNAFTPQILEVTHRSNRPNGTGPGNRSPERMRRPSDTARPVKKNSTRNSASMSPAAAEAIRRSMRPSAMALQSAVESRRPSDPPTPMASFFGPQDLPQPIETSRRTQRPMVGRPLVGFPAPEYAVRTNILRPAGSEMHIALPQPIQVAHYSNRSPGARVPRRERTILGSISGVPMPARIPRRIKQEQDWSRPDDHVSHLHEPIDSAPSSPVGSPTESSPAQEFTVSPPSSPRKRAKSHKNGRGIPGRRESLDDGFSKNALLWKKQQKERVATPGVTTPGLHVGPAREEFPFPATAETGTRNTERSGSSETIRPKRINAPGAPTGHGHRADATGLNTSPDGAHADYPICRSPVFERFKVAEKDIDPPPPFDLNANPSTTSHTTTTTVNDKDKPRDSSTLNSTAGHTPLDPAFSSNNSRISTADLDAAKAMGIAIINDRTPTGLPTPPDSLASSEASGYAHKMPSLAPVDWSRYRPASPSPGYTVASLPPKRKNTLDKTKELPPEFAEDVYRYLSLQYDAVACRYDSEMAEYTGLSVDDVKRDRRGALRRYIERFNNEHPDVQAQRGGFW